MSQNNINYLLVQSVELLKYTFGMNDLMKGFFHYKIGGSNGLYKTIIRKA
ncbi:hypothetical protein EDO6_02446 [Paenibacillus xylanexedens]|nr:hypothetical protein EDO6_02446 [Paenibacillus xylanexedens]